MKKATPKVTQSYYVKIANIHYKKGEYDQALKLYNEDLEIAIQLVDQECIARTLGAIGYLLIDGNRHIEALRYVLQAYKILERLHRGASIKAKWGKNISS